MGAEMFISGGLEGSSRLDVEFFFDSLIVGFVGLLIGELGYTTAAGGDLGYGGTCDRYDGSNESRAFRMNDLTGDFLTGEAE
jgi:hypothetical protein